MPRGDQTGPWGLGPRTGRGLGLCSGFRAPGFMYPGPGLGMGRGFGRGFGRGMGLGRGRGFWRHQFGGFRGDPHSEMAPFAYPYGAMPYSPYPPGYGWFYGPAYPGRRPFPAQEQQD
ncbi:MAG TPA: DUF5320 domain-containing protein [Acidobacteriota bacterium]